MILQVSIFDLSFFEFVMARNVTVGNTVSVVKTLYEPNLKKFFLDFAK